MYLHLGQNEIVSDHRIIGIFDLDKCSYGKRTREYLSAGRRQEVLGVSRRGKPLRDLMKANRTAGNAAPFESAR